eukprot:354411-Chlamydomonas_euryale.AAC.11
MVHVTLHVADAQWLDGHTFLSEAEHISSTLDKPGIVAQPMFCSYYCMGQCNYGQKVMLRGFIPDPDAGSAHLLQVRRFRPYELSSNRSLMTACISSPRPWSHAAADISRYQSRMRSAVILGIESRARFARRPQHAHCVGPRGESMKFQLRRWRAHTCADTECARCGRHHPPHAVPPAKTRPQRHVGFPHARRRLWACARSARVAVPSGGGIAACHGVRTMAYEEGSGNERRRRSKYACPRAAAHSQHSTPAKLRRWSHAVPFRRAAPPTAPSAAPWASG